MKDTHKMKIKEMLDVLEKAIDLGQYYEGDLYEHLCHEDRDEREDELDESDDVFGVAYEVLEELRKRLR